MPSATSVIDTADWRLVVPLRAPLNLHGSRLTAVMTSAFGGPSAVRLDSADGSIAWVSDTDGLTDALVLSVPVAARNGWLATAQIPLVFDVHRTVAGSPIDEWLGRSSVLVLPASDSGLVQGRVGFSLILVAGQPGSGVVTTALQTGPQGPKGEPGDGVLHVVSTAPAALAAGLPLALGPNGTLVRADTTSLTLARVVGLAAAGVEAGWLATAVRDHLYLHDWTAATGSADLDPGRAYFLAPGGGLVSQPDTASGRFLVRVGQAADPRTLVIAPSDPFLN